jgi:hypothetical protein
LLAEVKLYLLNPMTNDRFEYELKGNSEEPLAEDHIIIHYKAIETTVCM